VDANFDWGKDEFVGPTDGSDIPVGGLPLAQRIGPGVQDELPAGSQSITPAPILGVGSKQTVNTVHADPAKASTSDSADVSRAATPSRPAAIPGYSVSPGFPAPQPSDGGGSTGAAASSGPIKASPILPVSSAPTAKTDGRTDGAAHSAAQRNSAAQQTDVKGDQTAQVSPTAATANCASLLPIRWTGQVD